MKRKNERPGRRRPELIDSAIRLATEDCRGILRQNRKFIGGPQ
jgi:hypothetical protein